MSAALGPSLRARVGNALVLALLALLAVASASWQSGPWWVATPDAQRWFAAAALVVAYVALCTWQLRTLRTDRTRAMPLLDEDAVLVAWASQTGFAQQLAAHTADALSGAGVASDVRALDTVDTDRLSRGGRALFIVSTTGEGDAPDHALRVLHATLKDGVRLERLQYAVLALGDRRYAQFCEFGRRLDEALQHAGAKPLFDRIDVDAGDAGALRHWQHHLGQLLGRADLPDWRAPEYTRWMLVERECLNPGSPGGPVYRIALEPEDRSNLTWDAGDIAEIGPRNAPDAVDAWLGALDIDRDARFDRDGTMTTWAELASRSVLPPTDDARGVALERLRETLQRLPHREYSIASLPADGRLELVVRRMQDPAGRLGLGSGWLTQHAPQGTRVDLRIRPNPAFRAPDDNRPAVLIGNGTGIAGLRAVLKARIARGHGRNWLLFGERTRAHDALFDDEIERWHHDGLLARVDRVYSRDGSALRYVQDAMRARMEQLREWIDAGASIYVCGSLAGMAPAVDAVLRDAIGDDALDAMARDGRYRRDVY